MIEMVNFFCIFKNTYKSHVLLLGPTESILHCLKAQDFLKYGTKIRSEDLWYLKVFERFVPELNNLSRKQKI